MLIDVHSLIAGVVTCEGIVLGSSFGDDDYIEQFTLGLELCYHTEVPA